METNLKRRFGRAEKIGGVEKKGGEHIEESRQSVAATYIVSYPSLTLLDHSISKADFASRSRHIVFALQTPTPGIYKSYSRIPSIQLLLYCFKTIHGRWVVGYNT
jgi:hypothetical protein